MIDSHDWTSEEVNIFKKFNYKCIRCIIRDAVTLHELVPKSLAPKTWMKETNRVPLCAECHEWAHKKGTNYSRPKLIASVEVFFDV